MLRAAAGQKEPPLDSAETEIKGLDTVTLTSMPSSAPSLEWLLYPVSQVLLPNLFLALV